MFPSQYIACPECGASVEISSRHEHECDRERYVEYQVCLHRAEIERFEADFGAYLATPHCRFESWLAARERPPGGLEDPSAERRGSELDRE